MTLIAACGPNASSTTYRKCFCNLPMQCLWAAVTFSPAALCRRSRLTTTTSFPAWSAEVSRDPGAAVADLELRQIKGIFLLEDPSWFTFAAT